MAAVVKSPSWKYEDVVNVDLTVLLVVATGFVGRWCGILHKKDIPTLNTLVFKFTLPAMLIKGLGINTDLYDGSIWRFIAAFLILRALSLAGSLGVALFLERPAYPLGAAMTHWLAATWISTVILGVPVTSAVLGPQYASLGFLAGVSSFLFQLPLMLLGFEVDRWQKTMDQSADHNAPDLNHHFPPPSSPTDQSITAQHNVTRSSGPATHATPCQHQHTENSTASFWTAVRRVKLLEPLFRKSAKPAGAGGNAVELMASGADHTAAWGNQSRGGDVHDVHDIETAGCECPEGTVNDKGPHRGPPMDSQARVRSWDALPVSQNALLEQAPVGPPSLLPPGPPVPSQDQSRGGTFRLPRGYGITGAQLKSLGSRLLHNHPLWAIAIGLVLSLSTVGYNYLRPTSKDFWTWSGFVVQTLDWLGRCTEPVALFATGMWMVNSRWWRLDVKLGLRLAAYMVGKLVVVPIVGIACAEMMDLDDIKARGLVLLASLPVSAAAFTVTKEYGSSEDVMALHVILGVLLMLPTTVVWLEVLDALGLYKVP